MRNKFKQTLTKDNTRSKTPWNDYDLQFLNSRLEDEYREYIVSRYGGIPEEVMDELTDIANFCMFIWTKSREMENDTDHKNTC